MLQTVTHESGGTSETVKPVPFDDSPTAWMAQGNCRNYPPATFFPSDGVGVDRRGIDRDLLRVAGPVVGAHRHGEQLGSGPALGGADTEYAHAVAIDKASHHQEVNLLYSGLVRALAGAIDAKDRYTRAADYRRMDKRVDAFLEVKRKYDPTGRLRSAQSARLELT